MSETIKMDYYVAKQLIRELNAAELKKKWKQFLKEQSKRHGRETGNGTDNKRTENVEH